MRRLRITTEEKLERLIQERVDLHVQKLNRDYEMDLLKKKMDITVLQGQINPHFLYNALECIRGQALEENVPEIADITQALSEFFRYSISTKADVVSLHEELENVQSYMKIQQHRFKDRFHLDIRYGEVDMAVLHTFLLPKLTLQPIVENAIVHGFANKNHDAEIVIEIIRTKNHVNINIKDNGRGMDAGALFKLNDALSGDELQVPTEEEPKRSGIAMINVNKRLKLFFGESSGLTVHSLKEMGTDVEIHLAV